MNYAQIVEMCCQDLRHYLETTLANAKGGVVSIRAGRVLEIRRIYKLKMYYAYCLSRLLRGYRFGTGVYVLTKQQAEELLRNLDALCAEFVPRDKTPKQPAPKRPTAEIGREKMVLISFLLPHDLLYALEEWVRRHNTTRSEVVRTAIRQMLDKFKTEGERLECAASA